MVTGSLHIIPWKRTVVIKPKKHFSPHSQQQNLHSLFQQKYTLRRSSSHLKSVLTKIYPFKELDKKKCTHREVFACGNGSDCVRSNFRCPCPKFSINELTNDTTLPCGCDAARESALCNINFCWLCCCWATIAAAAAFIRCVIKLLLFDDWHRLAGTDVCVVPLYKLLLFNKLLLAFDVVFRLLFVNDCIVEFVIPVWDSDRLAAC